MRAKTKTSRDICVNSYARAHQGAHMYPFRGTDVKSQSLSRRAGLIQHPSDNALSIRAFSRFNGRDTIYKLSL